ncbi:MAG: hypothetical protein FJ318_09895 [SAR202 cluster bacterium]|nr:hypothetical protein [SAR202 cluster bacterium]
MAPPTVCPFTVSVKASAANRAVAVRSASTTTSHATLVVMHPASQPTKRCVGDGTAVRRTAAPGGYVPSAPDGGDTSTAPPATAAMGPRTSVPFSVRR